MTEPQDYIDALVQQRDAALNEVVNLRAELAALRRELEGQKFAEEAGE